jgi:hypothetical protein
MRGCDQVEIVDVGLPLPVGRPIARRFLRSRIERLGPPRGVADEEPKRS